jgi:hypothetical protein
MELQQPHTISIDHAYAPVPVTTGYRLWFLTLLQLASLPAIQTSKCWLLLLT